MESGTDRLELAIATVSVVLSPRHRLPSCNNGAMQFDLEAPGPTLTSRFPLPIDPSPSGPEQRMPGHPVKDSGRKRPHATKPAKASKTRFPMMNLNS